MAYSEHQADRIRQRLKKVNLTEEKKMMGGIIFMVNHKMCVGLDIDKTTGSDRLMVRVGKAQHDQLVLKKEVVRWTLLVELCVAFYSLNHQDLTLKKI